MRNSNQVVVLKFGSSVLRDENDLATVVHEIYRWWRHGKPVVAVVSALGETTNELTRLGQSIKDNPDSEALAQLLATGEAASAALLGLALDRAGIPARFLDPAQAGLVTAGPTLDSNLIAIDSERLNQELRNGVVVLPGFIGRNENGDTTLLGRGGSDLTALFVAQRLGGDCILLKDVDGLYTSDPAATKASRFNRVSYETAIRVAADHRIRFQITSIGANASTEVGPVNDQVSVSETQIPPLRVALFGCGTVGAGVYQRLAAFPHQFAVVGVATRSAERAEKNQIPPELITNDLNELIAKDCDVVVELIGGTDQAHQVIQKSLELGRNVVTANKAVLSSQVANWEELALKHDAQLLYSAAVGGVLPALETVQVAKTRGPIRRIFGVLNGTSNFVLEQIGDGKSAADAIKLAQSEGYAEADPKFDLDGTDAAQKLSLLARLAFDRDLPFADIRRQSIKNVDDASLAARRGRGSVSRVVAQCLQTANGLDASVELIELDESHPLYTVRGVDNRLVIESETGELWCVSGRGAGRWPTTEAVIADLFDLRRTLWSTSTVELGEECVA